MFKFKLLENENIISIHRKAEVALLKPALGIILAIYLPWFFLIKYDLHIEFRKILLFWTMLVFLFSLYKYILWLVNVCVITNKRLVSINYINIFHKSVLETPIEKIHNISYEVKGVFGSMFKYGNVIVQIASLSNPLILTKLKNPSEIKDTLWKINSKNEI